MSEDKAPTDIVAEMSALAAYQYSVYNNEALKLQEQQSTTAVIDIRENTLNDQKENEFEDDKNAKHILEYNSDSIQFIEAFPSSHSNINTINEFMCEFDINGTILNPLNGKQEPFLLFDVNDIKIDSIQIGADFCTKIKVYSHVENVKDLSKWNLLAIKRNSGRGNNVRCTFYLKYKHAKFIKICFGDFDPKDVKTICINKLIWNGIIAVIADEITDKMKVYQTSNYYHSNRDDCNILTSNFKGWNCDESVLSNGCFIIFDCDRYTIDRIRILFGSKSKPENVFVRLSEVANAYSFRNMKPIKSWQLKTAQTASDEDWKQIELMEDLIVADIYNDRGFKRYLQLEFSGYMMDTMDVIYTRFFGKKCANIAVESEQFDIVLDADENEEKQGINDRYEPKIIRRSKLDEFRKVQIEQNFSKDPTDPSFFHCVIPGFVIIDLGNNEVKYIRTIAQCDVKTVIISTCDRDAKENEWILLHKDDTFHLGSLNEYRINGKHKKYVKVEFMQALSNEHISFPLVEIQCFGDSTFLQKTVIMTLDEYKNQNPINIGFSTDFKANVALQYTLELRSLINVTDHMRPIIEFAEAGSGAQWIERCLVHWRTYLKQYYFYEELEAYTVSTVFEQTEALNAVAMKKQFCEEYAIKLANAQSNDNKKGEELQTQITETKEQFDSSAAELTQTNPNKLQTLRNKYIGLMQQQQQKEWIQVIEEMKENQQSMNVNNRKQRYENDANEDIYRCFKESVEQHPMIISNKYNVEEYKAMIEWANDNKPKEMEKLWTQLTHLLDKSLNETGMFLHKYFLFVLSNNGQVLHDSNRRPVWILFDCDNTHMESIFVHVNCFGTRTDDNVPNSLKVTAIYTAEHMEDQKWEKIGEIEWDNTDHTGSFVIGFEYDHDTGTGIRLKFMKQSKQYLRVVFENDCNGIPEGLKIHEIKLFDANGSIKPGKIVNASRCSYGDSVHNVYKYDDYDTFYAPESKEREYSVQISNTIRDKVCATLNTFRNGGCISAKEKHFIKFLLCWKNGHYGEILLTAKRIMNILSKPLITEYTKLQKQQAKILTLKLNDKDRLPSHVVSNHGLLKWDYAQWYTYRKAFFYPDDISTLAQKWINIGLPVVDKEFKDLRHNFTVNNKNTVFTSADELGIEYLNLIAARLDPSFQKTMKSLFEENRTSLSLKYPINNEDLGVLSGPIKTKARQNVKIKLDYCNKATPQVMNILDIVRCAIVCEEETELCNLFELITSRFSGKILRVKNAFDDINKGTYGYRAVLINIAYGDTQLLPKGFEMICEIQLLLLKYYQVRKNMHLGYGICRSEDNALNKSQEPATVLAEDSCKFGKLDI